MAPRRNRDNPLDAIARAVGGDPLVLDPWQPRDWPHRRGDPLQLDLHSNPLASDSPGCRSVACENCGGGAQCIHDNCLCWKCKGTFCFHCTGGGDVQRLCMTPVATVLRDGFALCPVCREPLRSIALVDCFRTILEMGGMFISENNSANVMVNKGLHLLKGSLSFILDIDMF